MIGPSSTPGRGGRLRRAPLWRVHPDIRGQGATIVEGGSGGAIVAVTARGHPVVLVPGGVLPGALAYGDLVSALGDRVDGVVKELEVYAGEEPPPGFSLDIEVEAIARAAEARNFDRFHLLGYSAGGACALAFVAAHGERLLSLALMEPAWAGHHRTAPEEALARRLAKLRGLPPDEFMRAFVTLQVAPGVQPPPRPDGPPPPWMARRPGGLRALIDAFDAADLDAVKLRRFDRPVYFALGGRSNPGYYGRMAARLREVFPDFTLETFAERHHFDPPRGLHLPSCELSAAAVRFNDSSSKGGGDMILATTKVADFDQFLHTFSTKGAEKRKEHGSRGSQVFRDPDDASRAWVVFDWETEGFGRFIADPEVPAIFQEAGLQGPPVKAEPAGEYDS